MNWPGYKRNMRIICVAILALMVYVTDTHSMHFVLLPPTTYAYTLD